MKTLKKIDVLQAAKISTILYAAFALTRFLVLCCFVFVARGLKIGGAQGYGIDPQPVDSFISIFTGSIGCFITVILLAVAYNFVAGKFGGIKIQIE